jgi:transcriptional regulator with XRE-family HTH domain
MHPLKREFKRLFDASGWTQAEAARKLHLTRGGVNGIVTGGTVPSASTLDLFRRVLIGEKPEALSERAPEREVSDLSVEEIDGALASLSGEERRKLASLAAELIKLVRSASRPAPSSGVGPLTEENLAYIKSVGDAIEAENARKAAEPSVQRSGPSGGRYRRSNQPTLPPKPGPSGPKE